MGVAGYKGVNVLKGKGTVTAGQKDFNYFTYRRGTNESIDTRAHLPSTPWCAGFIGPHQLVPAETTYHLKTYPEITPRVTTNTKSNNQSNQ